MSVQVDSLLYDERARKEVVAAVREGLILLVDDFKWLVKFVDEKNWPELFNITDEEFSRKFLCSVSCECEGQGDCDPDDCDCVFVEPRVGFSVQYNGRFGVLSDAEVVAGVVASARAFGVVGDVVVRQIVRFVPSPKPTTPKEAAKRIAAAGSASPEVVDEVLAAVLSMFREGDRESASERKMVESVIQGWSRQKSRILGR